jgi:hypothetical protein
LWECFSDGLISFFADDRNPEGTLPAAAEWQNLLGSAGVGEELATNRELSDTYRHCSAKNQDWTQAGHCVVVGYH